MKTLKVIWTFVNSKLFLYIILGIGVFLLINTFNKNANLRDDAKRKDKNIEALNADVRNYVTKENAHIAAVKAYEAHTNELEQYNKRLADEIRSIKGDVITYGNLIFKLRQDSADLAKALSILKDQFTSDRVNDSTWNLDWTLPYIYDSLNYDIYYGRTRAILSGNVSKSVLQGLDLSHKTWVLKRDSQMKLTWYQTYEKKQVYVYAKTDHPAFKATLLEGVYVDYPESPHWFTGFGIGPQLGVGYDFVNGKTGVTIGVGIQYNIFQW